MDNVREKILRAAIDRYGRGTQQFKAIEELSELIRALARCDDENIAEEMADVRIMLDQLELIFRNGQKVARYEVQKLRRLDQRVHAADVIGEESKERRETREGDTSSVSPSASHLPLKGKALGNRRRCGRKCDE